MAALTNHSPGTAQRLRIINPNPKYPKPHLIEPTPLGYLYIGASIKPSPVPWILPSAKRSRLLDHLKELAREPGEDTSYAIVNWASWDVSPPVHFWHQLSKKSFWSYVAPNLEQNRAGSMPVYCRLA